MTCYLSPYPKTDFSFDDLGDFFVGLPLLGLAAGGLKQNKSRHTVSKTILEQIFKDIL